MYKNRKKNKKCEKIFIYNCIYLLIFINNCDKIILSVI